MSAMSPVHALLQIGALRVVDHALAQSLLRLRPDTPTAVLLAAALCSRALAQGHSRLPLARVEELLAEIAPDGQWPVVPSTGQWLDALRASPWVFAPAFAGGVTSAATVGSDAVDKTFPAETASANSSVLVLEDDAIGLRRYWSHEAALAAALRSRLEYAMMEPDRATRERIAAVFPDPEDRLQARAAEIALGSRLLLLTGGPGTGKTRTVANILALLSAQASDCGTPIRIALAAPTGKAAARLAEAVREGAAGLSLPAQTLHRLLGLGGDGRPPRFDAANPLPFDVVVVDEASMVDLPMMARLLAAVSLGARLIVVGDPDQLPSVEAGAVLGALCEAARAPAEVPQGECPAAPLSTRHVHLERNYRQRDALALAPLSAAIRAGDAETAVELFAHSPGLRWQPGNDAALAAFVREHAVAHYRQIQACSGLADALAQAKRFRVLTALRDGPAGSATLNALIAQELRPGPDAGVFFRGRLLLINENSYRHGLFNGDIGLCWPDVDGVLRVWFENDGSDPADRDRGPRSWHPGQLPAHDSAFALTVHKAQGSEFGRVLLALPEHDARVITRELLYTGLSRGREGVLLWANEPVLRAAIARKMQRWNGLAARLCRPV